jgi:cytochrome P450 RapN
VSTSETEIVEYPIVKHDDLSMDPAYRALQQKGPFKAQLAFGEPIWVATRYEDVKTVYGDGRRFGKGLGIGRDTPRMYGMNIGTDPSRLDNMDPPNHTRVRRLASSAFTPAKIREMVGWVDAMTTELFDDIADHGPGADFMGLFAWKLPLRVVAGVLGISDEDIPVFKAWVDQLTGVESTLEERGQAHHKMSDYVRELIAERRTEARDDLLSVLVHARDADDRLSEDELVNIAMTLFLGGFETTAAQLGSTVWTLMTHRHLWQELLDEPDLLPTAVEELWRWIPSFRHGMPMIRWANEDVELSGGVVIPRGEPVLPEHQVANRDESVFANGWELDFHRKDPQPHMSLGWGSHRCMGAHLANLEVEHTLRVLLQRFPTLELTLAPEDVAWSTHTFLRSPAQLFVTW